MPCLLPKASTRCVSAPAIQRPGQCQIKQRRACIARAATERWQPTASLGQTLYEVLGVRSDVTAGDLRTAYRGLVSKLHPDANKGASTHERFQLVVLAFEVLGNKELRKQYDAHGLDALGPKYQDLRAMLRQGKATSSRKKGGVRGKDVCTVVGVRLSEAATGTERTITYEALLPCGDCQGSGSSTPLPQSCAVCNGTGESLRSYWSLAAQGTLGGLKLTQLAACPACTGRGYKEQPPCPRCQGKGRCNAQRQLGIRVPSGVTEHVLLRFDGAGSAGRYGGPAGDLLVKIEVHPDSNLVRQGDNLHSSVDVNVFEALLGGGVEVPTVRGRQLLAVPAGCQHGDVLRLKGAGVARAASGAVLRGDHFFTVRLRMPSVDELDEPARAILQELSGAGAGSASGAAGRRRPP